MQINMKKEFELRKYNKYINLNTIDKVVEYIKKILILIKIKSYYYPQQQLALINLRILKKRSLF